MGINCLMSADPLRGDCYFLPLSPRIRRIFWAVVFDRFFHILGTKKVVACRVRQGFVLYSNGCIAIGLGGPGIGRRRRVGVL